VLAAIPTATHAVILLAAIVGGAYGFGEFVGKTAAFGLDNGRNRDYWGDLGAVSGGLIGVVLWLGLLTGMLVNG
jgi:hypothetical protein